MGFCESHRREERYNGKTGQKERGLLYSPPPEQRVPKEDQEEHGEFDPRGNATKKSKGKIKGKFKESLQREFQSLETCRDISFRVE